MLKEAMALLTDGAFRLLDIRTKVSSYIWDKLEMPPISWHCKERGKGDQTNARIFWCFFLSSKLTLQKYLKY